MLAALGLVEPALAEKQHIAHDVRAGMKQS